MCKLEFVYVLNFSVWKVFYEDNFKELGERVCFNSVFLLNWCYVIVVVKNLKGFIGRYFLKVIGKLS